MLAALTMVGSNGLAAEGDAPAAKPAPKTLPPASAKTGLTFDKDIKPIFDASCIKCHGAQKPKAGLNLTTREGTLAGGKEGKVLTVGDGAKSLIVESVARINPDTAMPPQQRARRGGPGGPGPGGSGGEKKPEGAPAAAGGPEKQDRPPGGGPGGPGGPGQGPAPKPLTAEEVGIVRAWIDQGAK